LGLYFLIFVAVSLGVAGSYYLCADVLFRDASVVRRRIDTEFRRDSSELPLATALFRSPDQIKVDPGLGSASEDNLAERRSRRALRELRFRLEALIEQTGLQLTPGQLLGFMAGMGLALGVCGGYLRGPLLGIPATAVGSVAPLLYLYQKRKARRQKLLGQLPGAFDLMARVLRAGHSVPQALQAVADAFDAPIAPEFANCQKQQNLGLQPEITFQDLAQRTGILEVRIFVMALLIQQHTGGNLAEVLERLAGLVRTRIRFRNHVRTLTAEGRLQGLTLLVLPFLLFGAMMVVNRQYAEVLFKHVPLIVATGVSMTVGALWIRRIANFDV
jgi:tight adherence protein B